jgi:sugar lactone lactonase YvrE
MQRILSIVCLAASTALAQNSAYTLQTLVGAGRQDRSVAADSVLDGAYGLAEDSAGNVYVSESNAGIIRRVSPDGTMDRFAGTGTLGNGASGRPALQTDLSRPTVLLADKDGGLLFYEAQYCRIRKVQTDGILADIAGTGNCNSMQQSGTRVRKALETVVTEVGGMALDNLGRLVFTQPGSHHIRRLDTDGYIRIIAGTGTAGATGDDAAATKATLNTPQGLASDSSGNLFVADSINCRIRKIDTAGVITAVLGATYCAATTANYTGNASTPLDRPVALAYDNSANTLYIAMPRVFRVLRYDMNIPRVSQFLGNGKMSAADLDTPLTSSVNEASGVLASLRYGVLVASDSSYQVFRVQSGTVSRFAGHWLRPSETTDALKIPMLRPRGLGLSSNGQLAITDTGAGFLLRRETDGTVSALAGIPYPAGFWKGDGGTAVEATLDQPNRVVQKSTGEIYMTDGARIRVVDNTGRLRTLIYGLSNPSGLIFDPLDRLIIADSGHNKIIRLDVGNLRNVVIAGTGVAGYSGDGGDALEARFNSPGDLAFDSKGNLLIADRGNHRIRRILTDGTVETIAGNGLPLYYSDITGRGALQTGLGTLSGLTLDSQDNIYISEGVRVDKITKDGTVSVVTGFLSEADDGTRTYLHGPLNNAEQVAVDAEGRVYIAVRQDGRVVVATPNK